MRPARILVTGATGFIGSRLCERLSLDYRIAYRPLVRNYARAARIARLDTELVGGDLQDADSLARAVQGCDAVVHLAHSDDRTAARETALLVKACAHVRRFVHVSSMAVHGPAPTAPVVDESTPIRRWGEAYSDAKAAAEAVVMAAAQRGELPAVVLRPTIVYGPYSPFVTSIVDDARRGYVSLVDGGRGVCNAVYVDDVCDAILAALCRDDAVGEAFLVTGDDRITWRDFIQTFAGMVEGPKVVHDHAPEEIAAYWKARQPRARDNLTALGRLVASPAFHAQLATIPLLGRMIRGTKEFVAQRVTPEQKMTLKARVQGRRTDARVHGAPQAPVPSAGRVVREAYRSHVSNQRARAALGWVPAHGFAQGAARTGEWLRFARLASVAPALQDAARDLRKHCAAGMLSLVAAAGFDAAMIANPETKVANASERSCRSVAQVA